MLCELAASTVKQKYNGIQAVVTEKKFGTKFQRKSDPNVVLEQSHFFELEIVNTKAVESSFHTTFKIMLQLFAQMEKNTEHRLNPNYQHDAERSKGWKVVLRWPWKVAKHFVALILREKGGIPIKFQRKETKQRSKLTRKKQEFVFVFGFFYSQPNLLFAIAML